jgi:hypothetical protein
MQEVANAVAVRRAGIEHRFNLDAVGESHGRAGRIQCELVQKIASELSRVIGEDRL